MNTGKKGLDLIKKYEGFFSKPYLDPIGIPTIGYGATYYPNKVKVTMKDKPITETEASDLLVQMLKVYENQVALLVRKPINQNQFDALVSFTYNLGATNLGKSTLLKKVNANPQDKSISDEFMKWNRASGKVFNGLTKRRKDEAALYFS
ncbi:Phage-related lysozyme (muraminidase) [Algoriella xinjiangensis]|uniref:lysozyme n=1 Tax=Algoriella xinjiangensis TaxID=684065 RepID=UPI000F6339AF|nr:lysozyme [Algoriella xinjiangensis]VDH16096.1 Phage-related lysozyme (muraminidase) [Algoriella xinjiangensis]